MAFPETPQDLAVELLVGGAWVDVTGDVRQDDGIEITRGQSSEGGQAQASVCSFKLDNTSGNYSPRNPNGAYFGSLGRNTPVRVTLGEPTVAADAYGRTVVAGHGSADTGGAWTTFGSGGSLLASDYNVASGAGTHSVPVVSGTRHTVLDDNAYTDVDVTVTATITGISAVTGDELTPGGLLMRWQSSTDYYYLRVAVTTAETIRLILRKVIAGVTTNLVSSLTVPGLTYTGQALRTRAQIEGNTLRGKAWDAAEDEPAGWHIVANDTAITAAGGVGIRSAISPDNTNTLPVVFSYDNFAATDLSTIRCAPEVSSWPPRSDVSGNDVYTSVEASGILRRLSQGASPLNSPMHRAQLSPARATPVAYWTLEDGRDATEFGSAVGGLPMRIQGDVTPSASDTFACSKDLPQFGPGVGPLVGDVGPYTDTGLLTAYMLLHVPAAGVAADGHPLLTLNMGGSGVLLWSLQGGTAAGGTLKLQALDANRAILLDTGFVDFDLNDRPLLVTLTLTQNGTGIDYALATTSVGSAAVGGFSGTLVSQTLGRCIRVTVGSNISLNEVVAGHVTLKTVADYSLHDDALQAHTGETAVERMSRLCQEEGVTLTIHGNSDDTVLMGPQTVDTLLDLITQAAEVDHGILGESRSALGLSYRTRTDLYNQDALLTLDYSAHELNPGFAPTDDDRGIRNDVTVTRVDGATARYVQETGPLSVEAAPVGVGRYDDAVTVNLYTDTQVLDHASWMVHLGTVDEPRFPTVGINLARDPALRTAALSVDLGSRLVVTNPPTWLPPDDISTLVQGYTEYLNRFEHTFDFSCVPESPYRVIELDDDAYRLDSDATTLDEDLDTTETGVTVAISDGTLWTTSGAEYPFDIVIGGEVMTATACTGASSPQTFTVTRSVNGVVKTHSTGAEVRLAQTPYLAL